MKLTNRFRYPVLLICLLALSLPVCGQSGRGTITGTVMDSTGGLVPGAEVTAVNVGTGVESRTVTTDVGLYRIPYVNPGKYRVSVSLAGFKTAVRENVDVLITQTVTVDFKMEVGELADHVTVSTVAPLLEKSTSEIGTATTQLEVHTWPILVGDGTRQLQSFVFRAMPGTQGNEWSGSINGGQSFAHEILIDGISIGRMDIAGGSNNEFTPTVDAISEFKLQTGALSAQYGNSQTGLTNFGMKGGTNEYHGSAFWFHQNEALNSNSWGNNLAGAKKRPFRLHNFGATFGGPVIKDKTHFFFSYEGNRQVNYTMGGFSDSLPVAPFKKGEFGLLFDPNFTRDPRSGTIVGQDALGRDVRFGQIYDPASTRQLDNGSWIRDPFPGNLIPANRMSGVSSRVLQYTLPEPALFQLRNNNQRVTNSSPELIIDNYSFKLDHILSSEHKLGGSYVFNDRYRHRYGSGSHYYLPDPQIPGSPLTGDKLQATPGWIVRVSEDWTISPVKLNHFAIGYNRFRNANQSNSFFAGKDWAEELGLKNVGGATFPELRFQGNNVALSGSYRNFGHQGTGIEPNGSVIIQDDFTWIRGSHSFRFGGEHRRYYINSRFSDTPGRYDFHNENTALPGFANQTGFAFASFYTGAVRATSVGINRLTPGIRSRVSAFYIQDDWKAKPNLTFNLGFRWDIPQPFSESKGAMSALNPTKPNPGADGYPGALEFLTPGQGSFGETYWKQFGPRVGLAWAVTPTTVLRGGYGVNFSPPILDGWNYGWFDGFNGSNNINTRSRSRFNEDPSYYWDTPYPAYTGVLPNTDPALMNGDYVPYYPPETNKLPKTQNWNFGIQRELPWATKLEVNYVASRGTRLNEPYMWNLNQVDPRHLALGDVLLEDINDHPEYRPYQSFEGTVAQALRPFPQYYGVSSHRLASGWSNYNSLQMTMTKRGSQGLSFLTSYTFSKSLATADNAIGQGYYGAYGQDIYNRKLDYGVTQFHVPHDLRLTWIYDLPIGPGRRFLSNNWMGKIIGGWTMSAIQHYRSGAPLSVYFWNYDSEALFNPGFRADVVLPRDQQVLAGQLSSVDRANGTPYLNPAAFAPLPTTDNNVPLRLGNAPRYLPNVRGFRQLSEDFSLLKKFDAGFREGANFEVRIDVINLFNRIRIGDPETDVGDPERFGRVFNKVGSPRVIQGGLRVSF
jgi:outer membrane receptor protein involved in Fe transport